MGQQKKPNAKQVSREWKAKSKASQESIHARHGTKKANPDGKYKGRSTGTAQGRRYQ